MTKGDFKPGDCLAKEAGRLTAASSPEIPGTAMEERKRTKRRNLLHPRSAAVKCSQMSAEAAVRPPGGKSGFVFSKGAPQLAVDHGSAVRL